MIIYLRNLLLFNVYVCGLYLLPFGVPAPAAFFTSINVKINHELLFRVVMKKLVNVTHFI